MKLIILACAATVLLNGCNSPAESQSKVHENRVVVKNISFTIDSVYFSAGSVHAAGTLKNVGTQSVAPLFYVSGEFFKRNTYATSLGEARSLISQGVKIGEVVPWTLSKAVTGDTAQFTQPALAKMQLYYVE